ncbi:phiSA1p31-related protein [Streptomyces chumphonensis]|uniref:phiSA1p31-related protein n=1 Tax=Streptomyces chumphonensis TaxID=1214925 RepID=UPI003D73E902
MKTPRIRMLDLDEYAFVLTVTTDGVGHLTNPRMCDAVTADVLRRFADQLDAAHPPYSCDPSSEPEPQHERLDEPLNGRSGVLHSDRSVWTDGRGHRWDLSLTWGDVTERAWQWTGVLDRVGTPMMRAADGERASLDVVRALYGPIAPFVGGAA